MEWVLNPQLQHLLELWGTPHASFSLCCWIMYLRLKWNKVLFVFVVHFACYDVSDIHHCGEKGEKGLRTVWGLQSIVELHIQTYQEMKVLFQSCSNQISPWLKIITVAGNTDFVNLWLKFFPLWRKDTHNYSSNYHYSKESNATVINLSRLCKII